MSKVYRNKPAIPIPPEAKIKNRDGRVYINVDVNGVTRPVIIGYAATKFTMFVNDTFRDHYPNEWIQYYGKEELKPDRLYIGCYAITFGIIHKFGLYPLLLNTYEPTDTNAILDYAMYYILYQSSVTQLYPERMRDEVLFSNTVYDDSWYSGFFKRLSTDQHHRFRMEWLKHCKECGVTKAWISIDGSNNDCELKESDLSEYGYAKSHNDSKIVSFIYAVNAEDGRPLTYCVNPGSVVDCKAFQEIAGILKDVEIEIEGVILDSGFCTYEVIQTILKCKYRYVIMTPADTHGHTSVMKTEGEKIRWKSKYCVSDYGVFGTSKKHVLFGNHSDLEAYINLYFDGIRGSRQSAEIVSKIRSECRKLQTKLSEGKKAQVPNDLKSYLRITKDEHEKDSVELIYETWDQKMESKGYFSIASSDDFGAEKTLQLYHLRDASETGYCIIKSQQGCHTTRVHSDEGIETKFAICFIGNIIRHEIMLACKSLQLDTNVMIRRLDRIYLRRGISNAYYDVKMITTDQEKLLGLFNIEPGDFEQFAKDVNKRRNTKISNNVYPAINHEKTGAKVVSTGKRGRPRGSKNKRTLEKEAAIEAMKLCGLNVEENKEKRPVGRPKNSRDSKPRKRRTKAEILAAQSI